MTTNNQNTRNWTESMLPEHVEKLKEILGRYSEKNRIHQDDHENK
ncbi:hypothetical protein [Virgibacillus doumboii]|nr:hypothetical protein [Virgibacillus doumboii]